MSKSKVDIAIAVIKEQIDEYQKAYRYWDINSGNERISEEHRKEAGITADKYVTRLVAVEQLLFKIEKELHYEKLAS